MTRRMRWLAQATLVAVLALLAFPGASSALRPTFTISLTASGPDPTLLSTPAGLGPVVVDNTDTATHTIAFANGLCSEDIAPNTSSDCDFGFLDYVGDYAYTVDGTTEAHVVIKAVGRGVSLRARRDSIRLGLRLRLHGRLWEANANWSPPGPGSPQPILVPARRAGSHTFHRIGVVMATVYPPTKRAPFGKVIWRLRVHPRVTTAYMAEANYQPKGGQVWQQARSKPFTVRVRSR